MIDVSALQKAACENQLTFTATPQTVHTRTGQTRSAENFVGVC